MAVAAQAMEATSLRLLNRAVVEGPPRVKRLLERVRSQRIALKSGIDGHINQRRASLLAVSEDSLTLRVKHLNAARVPQLYFQFEIDNYRYFFAADVLTENGDGSITVAIPPAIHEVERRSLPRNSSNGEAIKVTLASAGGEISGSLVDRSYDGASVRLAKGASLRVGANVRVSFEGIETESRNAFGVIRNSTTRRGWTRVGLSVSKVPFSDRIAVETRSRILDTGLAERTSQGVRFYGAAVGMATSRLSRALGVDAGAGDVEVLRYNNNLDQPMVAIADRVGDPRGGVAVVVAPAWGRTKETMLPLAAVLCETYAKAGEPLAVVRFDGTNRRGESWIDPDCREPGSEYLRFRFSQSVKDIQATVQFIKNHPDFRPDRIILVTASLASVEGRRVVAADLTGAIAGWVSLVGMVDLQSGLRSASGGVDYAFGLERGAHFGRHELAGVIADMDLTGRDVLESHLGLYEDARRDMAAIDVPVTWIHGKHDGWIELARVRDLMSAGDTRLRRLIQVPTGHQLRSSRQAMETFQLVAQEVSRISIGRPLQPAVPRGRLLEAKRRAERERRPQVAADFKEFWEHYVLGRTGHLGIEILAATRAYRGLMAEQIARLQLENSSAVADLGSGAGDFAVGLADEKHKALRNVHVTAVDFLSEALRRGRKRAEQAGTRTFPVVADLDAGVVPLASASFDAVLLSLVISYVASPERLLREARRVLKPGGRVVVSCPRRDADLSKIYVDGVRELDPGTVRSIFGPEAEVHFPALQRDLLNQGAKLLSLEEEGWFRFRDREELARLVEAAGFVGVRSTWSFGDPPQVALVSAVRS